MALGYVIAFAEDALSPNTAVSYWDGAAQTDGATADDLNEAEFYNDSDVNEQDLMNVLGNVQLANTSRLAVLKRAEIEITLV